MNAHVAELPADQPQSTDNQRLPGIVFRDPKALRLDPVDGKGFVYGLSFSTGVLKVGCTRKPRQRINSLLANADAFGAALVEGYLSEPHSHYRASEISLLVQCRGASTSTHGEYFRGIAFDDFLLMATALGLEVPPVVPREVSASSLEEPEGNPAPRCSGAPDVLDPSLSDLTLTLHSIFGRESDYHYGRPAIYEAIPWDEAREIGKRTSRHADEVRALEPYNRLASQLCSMVREEADRAIRHVDRQWRGLLAQRRGY